MLISNITVNFYFLNLFQTIYLVYCRIFTSFFVTLFKIFLKIDSLNVTNQMDDF